MSPNGTFHSSNLLSSVDPFPEHQHLDEEFGARDEACQTDAHENISIPASSKYAGQTVAPFLARHIPDQYAPMGALDPAGVAERKDPNTKYCYRHRPDRKCRRQPNEPSMEQLQHVSVMEASVSPKRLTHFRNLRIYRRATNKP